MPSTSAAPLALISIHAPREGGDEHRRQITNGIGISIHAPREGGDAAMVESLKDQLKISIHAPREGGDTLPDVLSYQA